MKLLAIASACIPLVAAGGESYFFTLKKGAGGAETRVDGNHLTVVRAIQKIEPPKASRITAYHQGLGKGREYKIQINLEGTLEKRWHPMLKLEDDIISRGISIGYSNSKTFPSTISIEDDDPNKIRRWSQALATLLELPEERVTIDLAKSKTDSDGGPDTAPKPDDEDGRNQDHQLDPDTRWRLNGESEWKMNKGPTISLRESKVTGFSYHDPEGNELFRLEKHELVREVVKSPQRDVLLFQIDHDDGFGGSVLRVSMQDDVPKFERLLAHPTTPLFEGKRWWISDLGAISDDGDVILARFGWMPQGGGRVSYEWQTWSIGNQKRLGRGLQVSNGKIGGG